MKYKIKNEVFYKRISLSLVTNELNVQLPDEIREIDPVFEDMKRLDFQIVKSEQLNPDKIHLMMNETNQIVSMNPNIEVLVSGKHPVNRKCLTYTEVDKLEDGGVYSMDIDYVNHWDEVPYMITNKGKGFLWVYDMAHNYLFIHAIVPTDKFYVLSLDDIEVD